MLSNKQEKLVRSLQQKKFRNQEGLFVIEGEKLIREAQQEGLAFHSLFLSHEAEFIKDYSTISEQEMKKISSFKSPPGFLAVLPLLEIKTKNKGLTLVLDDISDPGNLGTIIRTAEAFGVAEIICSLNSVDQYNPKVVQASMGSIFRMPIHYVDLETYLSSIPEEKVVYGASLDGENIYDYKLQTEAVLVMGSESHGISKSLYPFIKNRLFIPQKGKVESMNVSIATAVMLAEFNRF